ncbi:MAG: two-component system, NarL family, response regulator DesR [Gaiellaceae bacterium]|nr:two-component system, NarL family, response regulator DesR [Gaiellaceae bacterium]
MKPRPDRDDDQYMSTQDTRSGITVVLADDHPPIIDCLTRHLGANGFDVVDTAQDGERALASIEQHHPLVCVADVRMPRIDGLELARRAAVSAPDTAVLLYSGVSDKGLVSDALDAGARGFALKDAPLEDLTRAIDTVATGGLYVDPVLAAALATRRVDERKPLSEREREVLRMLSEGGSYAEIGSTLFLSPDTVRAHAQRAMTKLGARTRTQAVAVALREAVIG